MEIQPKKCYNIIITAFASSIGGVLPFNLILRSYDRIQHTILMDSDLV